MKFKQKSIKKRGALDVTPLIDVVFLLLLFFMITSTFVSTTGIKVNLPKAKSKVKQSSEAFEVGINEKNQFFFQGVRIQQSQLAAKLKTAWKSRKTPELVIKADGEVRHKDVVFVMDLANKTGIKKLHIATRLPNEK